MKRILIVNNNMYIGGVQKALCSLLASVKDDYEITLLLFSATGECMKDIPDGINVISLKRGYRYLGMTKYDVEGHPIHFIKRSFYAAVSRILGRKTAISIMSLTQKKLKGFDAAISYLHNSSPKAFYGGCNDFVIKHTDAHKKIAFLHCDYVNCGAHNSENTALYNKFDIIAACSAGCGRTFIKANPQLSEKVVTVRNCYDFDKISALSNSDVDMCSGYINILTVARLGKEKGILRGIEAIANLGELASKVKYYIIGDGAQRQQMLDLIEVKGLRDTVIWLGEKANPYPYMKKADFLFIPSVSEGAPLVIDESAYLGTPILSARTSSVDEMIINSGFGWVCDDLSEGLYTLVSQPEKIREKKDFLSKAVHNNYEAAAQFAGLFE